MNDRETYSSKLQVIYSCFSLLRACSDDNILKDGIEIISKLIEQPLRYESLKLEMIYLLS